MAKRAFDMMMEGLDDAVAFVGGDSSKGRIANPVNVKIIRKRAGKTQAQFAATYRVPVGTLRDWEQGRSVPDGPARVLLGMIEVDPEAVEVMIAKIPA